MFLLFYQTKQEIRIYETILKTADVFFDLCTMIRLALVHLVRSGPKTLVDWIFFPFCTDQWTFSVSTVHTFCGIRVIQVQYSKCSASKLRKFFTSSLIFNRQSRHNFWYISEIISLFWMLGLPFCFSSYTFVPPFN